MPPKYLHLLKDADVRRWRQNVARGSRITSDVYLRRLGGFCAGHGITPAQLVRLKPKELRNLLLDTVGSMEGQGRAGGYIASVMKAVKSWLSFVGVDVKGGIKIRGVDNTPTLQDERAPSQEELKGILLAGDEKARTASALLAFSGLRPETLGNYDGTDGLIIKDLPDLEITDNQVAFKTLPAMVRVRPALSKKANEYFTFLGEEGCQYLKSYLELRLRRGEVLGRDSAVITPKTAKKKFIRTLNIGDAVRKAIRKAGFPWRPYVLRSYFATQMMLAESKGLIIRDYRSFFMGHKGDIEAVYTLNKRRLPPEVMEQMRESYAKALRYLQTSEATSAKEDMTRHMRRQFLRMAGLKTEEITDQQLELDEEVFQEFLQQKFVEKMKGNAAGQQVVDLSEVESRLAQGWEFVGLLPENKAIVKRAPARGG